MKTDSAKVLIKFSCTAFAAVVLMFMAGACATPQRTGRAASGNDDDNVFAPAGKPYLMRIQRLGAEDKLRLKLVVKEVTHTDDDPAPNAVELREPTGQPPIISPVDPFNLPKDQKTFDITFTPADDADGKIYIIRGKEKD